MVRLALKTETSPKAISSMPSQVQTRPSSPASAAEKASGAAEAATTSLAAGAAARSASTSTWRGVISSAVSRSRLERGAGDARVAILVARTGLASTTCAGTDGLGRDVSAGAERGSSARASTTVFRLRAAVWFSSAAATRCLVARC